MLDLLAKRLHEEFGLEISGPLLLQAVTHSSWAFENGAAADNERLEFLGDSVLGLAVSAYLFHNYPQCAEGELSRLRSDIVSGKSLAQVARQWDLGKFLRLGRGEIATGGSDKSSLLSDLVESLIGAVMLDQGFEKARQFALDLLSGRLAEIKEMGGAAPDPKTRLQKLLGAGEVAYEMTEEGPPHDRLFTAAIEVGGRRFSAVGRSKKAAQAAVADKAAQELDAGTS